MSEIYVRINKLLISFNVHSILKTDRKLQMFNQVLTKKGLFFMQLKFFIMNSENVHTKNCWGVLITQLLGKELLVRMLGWFA